VTRRFCWSRQTTSHPPSRLRCRRAWAGEQASQRASSGRPRKRGRASLSHASARADCAGPPLCQTRMPNGRRQVPSVQINSTRETPSPGWPSRREDTPARGSMAVAKGVGSTGSSMRRSPRAQTKRVRTASSRRVCPDQGACPSLVTRAWDPVGNAAAKAVPVAEVRSYRKAVRESHRSSGSEMPPFVTVAGNSLLSHRSCVTSARK
jgi:hypothetical protein